MNMCVQRGTLEKKTYPNVQNRFWNFHRWKSLEVQMIWWIKTRNKTLFCYQSIALVSAPENKAQSGNRYNLNFFVFVATCLSHIYDLPSIGVYFFCFCLFFFQTHALLCLYQTNKKNVFNLLFWNFVRFYADASWFVWMKFYWIQDKNLT